MQTKVPKELSPRDLEVLKPIIDQLLTGSAEVKYDVKDVALRLAALGYPGVLDCTEQLRLALRLLECHETSVGKEKRRPKSARTSEAGLV